MKSYEELLAERDALASQIENLRSLFPLDYLVGCDGFLNYPTKKYNNVVDVFNSTPAKCLAEIKADAAEVAYYNGFKGALVIEPPLPPATCTSATIDVFAYRVDQASRYAASQYANKIRNTGTWLKDSNVNGGKRQGGEK